MQTSIGSFRKSGWPLRAATRIARFLVAAILSTAAIAQSTSAGEGSFKFKSFDPPGSTLTRATGITARGEVVGFYNDSSGLQHGFLMSGQNFTIIDIPGATTGTASTGANNALQIVGAYSGDDTINQGREPPLGI